MAQALVAAGNEEGTGWGLPMGALLAAAVVAAAWFGYQAMNPGEPPDILESRARSIAEKQLDQFCGGGGEDGGAKCVDFYFKGTFPPSEDRFRWSFHFLSEFTEPRRLVIVSVTAKGEAALGFEVLPAEADLTKYGPPPATAAAAAETPAEGGEPR